MLFSTINRSRSLSLFLFAFDQWMIVMINCTIFQHVKREQGIQTHIYTHTKKLQPGKWSVNKKKISTDWNGWAFQAWNHSFGSVSNSLHRLTDHYVVYHILIIWSYFCVCVCVCELFCFYFYPGDLVSAVRVSLLVGLVFISIRFVSVYSVKSGSRPLHSRCLFNLSSVCSAFDSAFIVLLSVKFKILTKLTNENCLNFTT